VSLPSSRPREHVTALSSEQLRWRCDPDALGFETTAEVRRQDTVVGQPAAWEALEFGLQCDAPGQNVYIRGMPGTGRMTMVRRMLDKLAPQACNKRDRCYVHNFARPDRPRLITLPAGAAAEFRRLMRELSEFVAEGLPQSLNAEAITAERAAVQERVQAEIRAITEPFDADLRTHGMALVTMQQGNVAQNMIFPLVNGEPVPPQQYFQLVAQGKLPEQEGKVFERRIREEQKRLAEVTHAIDAVYRNGLAEISDVNERSARALLSRFTDVLIERYDTPAVRAYLDEVMQDVVDTRLDPGAELPAPELVYGVNVVLEHHDDGAAPVVEENNPSLINLLGTVEPGWDAGGAAPSDYRSVHAGALLRADGGYLILDIHELLTQPGSWTALTRTLRNGCLEIVPAEVGWMRPHAIINPDPIPIAVRVILVGDAMSYYQLDAMDPDFSELFKVLVDFDHEIDRADDGISHYVSVVTSVVEKESLPPFHASAVARLVEHGARIAARNGKLTARFGRVADIAREAAFLARGAGEECVAREHVEDAVRRTKSRASLPSRKFRSAVESGTIMIQTAGEVVGQVNGLAVIQSGMLTYGFPARITATIGPGRAGIINIEGRAAMSGSIHTKGFHILGGLLRHLLRTGHPLAFSASIAFEQSYGGIDGDSASGAEMCCLLSALTGFPIDQSFAMTGAIDQHGHIQAIGGVNEKVEGFFDTCRFDGLSGRQGVVIPRSNAGDLMLREDVVQACSAGRFHIYAVTRIEEALEILMGRAVGAVDESGSYPPDTLLGVAVQRAREFWRETLASPAQLTSVERYDDDDDDDDGDGEA
jgi:ATP-dependent Lon protease